VRFVDMPWLLEPDHSGVMVYPRYAAAQSMEMVRLYALGIDAWRLVQLVIQADKPKNIPPLDGVTGRGHYVGTYMAWGVNNNGWWGEGEIKFFMDGDGEFPTICGTGTDDGHPAAAGALAARQPRSGRPTHHWRPSHVDRTVQLVADAACQAY